MYMYQNFKFKTVHVCVYVCVCVCVFVCVYGGRERSVQGAGGETRGGETAEETKA